ncbi:MAG: hypothetical protein A2W03_10330 [Candidatus Aminicenantes bacterium RBG_16_63_16]|nr:MAG: hypothetical protein A2W03_10330 [Candidatus Aminicenantes bacterium RBG_16_63_16]
MNQQSENAPGKRPDIAIDYENIDVARIMDDIKARVAGESVGESASAGAADSAPVPDFDLRSGDAQPPARGRARGLALRLMSPFRPLIKLLILPVYDEFQQTVRILHNTNLRLDHLYEVTDRDRHNAIVRLDRQREYTKLLHSLSHNLVVELTKLKIENDTLKARLEILEKDFDFLGKRERALEREVLE